MLLPPKAALKAEHSKIAMILSIYISLLTPSSLLALLLLLLLPQHLLVAALEADALDLQHAVLAMPVLQLGEELPHHIEQALCVQGHLGADPEPGGARRQGCQQQQLVLVVLVQAAFLLDIVQQAVDDSLLAFRLSHGPNVPDHIVADEHAADAVLL